MKLIWGVLFVLFSLAFAQDYPPGTSNGCTYENLTCSDGAYFNNSMCYHWVPSPNPGSYWYWYAIYKCNRTDPTGYNGTDAGIVNSDICTPQGLYWDDNFINLNTTNKTWECFVQKDGQTWMSLWDHRVPVNINFETGNATFQVLTRVWNSSFNGWNPIMAAVNCTLWQCNGTTSTDGTSAALVCQQSNCTGCGVADGCSAQVSAMAKGIKGQVSLSLSNIGIYGSGNGSATGFLKTNQFGLVTQCYVGSCTDVEPDPGFTSINTEMWATIIVVCSGVGLCVLMMLFSWRSNASKQRLAKIGEAALLNRTELFEDDGYGPQRNHYVALTFKDVCYDVSVQQSLTGERETRRVLTEICGVAQSGEVLALLGQSGSGKTTLLDILACRAKVGSISGQVHLFCDGYPLNRYKSPLLSYVPADADASLVPTQTVYEHVYFAAQLRLPPEKYGNDEKKLVKKVVKVLCELGLDKVMKSRVGRPGDGVGGISTGERKRTTIAMELVTEPLVLLLDEPTSGLDSYNASLLMKTVKKAAKEHGLLCAASIHQPSSAVFSLFDKLVLLSRTGRVAYSGSADQAIAYLSTNKLELPPEGYSIAEHLLEMASHPDIKIVENMVGKFADSQELHVMKDQIDLMIRGEYVPPAVMAHTGYDIQHPLIAIPIEDDKKSGPAKAMEEALLHGPPPPPPPPPRPEAPLTTEADESSEDDEDTQSKNLNKLYGKGQDEVVKKTWPVAMRDGKEPLIKSQAQVPKKRRMAAFHTQLILLSARAFSNIWRDRDLLIFNYLFSIIAASAMGALFFGLDHTFGGTQDRAGFLFFIIFLFALTGLSLLARHVEERDRFLTERDAGYYNTMPYMLSKIISDIFPLRVLPPLIFGGITYWMVGLQDDSSRFMTFMVILVLTNVVVSCACFFFASFCPDTPTANLVAVLYIVFSMLFGGLFFNPSQGSGSTAYAGYFRYGSFFHYAYDALMINEFQNMDFTFNLDEDDEGTISYTGDFVLSLLAIDNDNFIFDVTALLSMAIFFFLAGFILLSMRSLAKR